MRHVDYLCRVRATNSTKRYSEISPAQLRSESPSTVKNILCAITNSKSVPRRACRDTPKRCGLTLNRGQPRVNHLSALHVPVSLHKWNQGDVRNKRSLKKRLLNANYITMTIESIPAKIEHACFDDSVIGHLYLTLSLSVVASRSKGFSRCQVSPSQSLILDTLVLRIY